MSGGPASFEEEPFDPGSIYHLNNNSNTSYCTLPSFFISCNVLLLTTSFSLSIIVLSIYLTPNQCIIHPK